MEIQTSNLINSLTYYLRNYYHLIVPIVVSIFLITQVQSFGIHIDEFIQTSIGQTAYSYYIDKSIDVYEHKLDIYSIGSEFPITLLARAVGYPDTSVEWYMTRNLIILTTWSMAAIFLSQTIKNATKNSIIASTAALIYLLLPNSIGIGPVTCKDPLMVSFIIIGQYFFFHYLRQQRLITLVLTVLFMAYASTIRLSALPIIALSYAFIGVPFLTNPNINNLKKVIFHGLLAASLTIVINLGAHPFTSQNPLAFFDRLNYMTNFENHGRYLYQDQIIQFSQLTPDKYFKTYLLKTPELIIATSLLGLCVIAIFKPYRNINNLYYLIMFIAYTIITWTVAPPLYSVRHLGIYVPLMIYATAIALYFLLQTFSTRKYIAYVLAAFIVTQLLYINFRLHPYQLSYYNVVSGGISRHYNYNRVEPETLTFKEITIYMCQNLSSGSVAGPFISTYLKLYCPEKFTYTDNYQAADYIVSYPFYSRLLPIPDTATMIHNVQRDNTILNAIYENQ